jgi:hypothetical protein
MQQQQSSSSGSSTGSGASRSCRTHNLVVHIRRWRSGACRQHSLLPPVLLLLLLLAGRQHWQQGCDCTLPHISVMVALQQQQQQQQQQLG